MISSLNVVIFKVGKLILTSEDSFDELIERVRVPKEYSVCSESKHMSILTVKL